MQSCGVALASLQKEVIAAQIQQRGASIQSGGWCGKALRTKGRIPDMDSSNDTQQYLYSGLIRLHRTDFRLGDD